jgi:hypothetical protein
MGVHRGVQIETGTDRTFRGCFVDDVKIFFFAFSPEFIHRFAPHMLAT